MYKGVQPRDRRLSLRVSETSVRFLSALASNLGVNTIPDALEALSGNLEGLELDLWGMARVVEQNIIEANQQEPKKDIFGMFDEMHRAIDSTPLPPGPRIVNGLYIPETEHEGD